MAQSVEIIQACTDESQFQAVSAPGRAGDRPARGRRRSQREGKSMSEIIQLPGNLIGKEDREKLESFAGHTIAHGRATRWHWGTDAHGNDVLEIYRGGAEEQLAARLGRDRQRDAFRARDASG